MNSDVDIDRLEIKYMYLNSTEKIYVKEKADKPSEQCSDSI